MDTRKRIAEVTSYIESINENIEKLEDERDQYSLELLELKAVINLANKLPEEIYSKIFYLVVYASGRPIRPSLLDLSHVCASWRRAALNSPLL